LARFVCSFSAVIVSGRSIFHWPPAVAEAPELLPLLPERPDELLPDVLERSAVELPAPELLLRLVLLLPAEFAPELELLPIPLVLPPLLEVLWRLPPVLLPAEFAPELLPRLAELLEAALLGSLDEALPLPEVELASLRGEDELLEPAPLPEPVLEPLPLLEPLPDAPLDDSRTSETVTSGAPWLCGKVTIATPYPFCTPLLDEPLKPEEVEELPLRPLPLELLRSAPVEPVPLDELLELRSVLEEAPMPLLLEELLRSALVPELVPAPLVDDPMPLELLRSVVLEEEVPLLLRSVVDEEDEPMPPLVEDEPDRPPLEEPLLESERRLLLPRLPLLPLELPLLDEFTGQLESSAGFWTSPWTIWMFLN